MDFSGKWDYYDNTRLVIIGEVERDPNRISALIANDDLKIHNPTGVAPSVNRLAQPGLIENALNHYPGKYPDIKRYKLKSLVFDASSN